MAAPASVSVAKLLSRAKGRSTSISAPATRTIDSALEPMPFRPSRLASSPLANTPHPLVAEKASMADAPENHDPLLAAMARATPQGCAGQEGTASTDDLGTLGQPTQDSSDERRLARRAQRNEDRRFDRGGTAARPHSIGHEEQAQGQGHRQSARRGGAPQPGDERAAHKTRETAGQHVTQHAAHLIASEATRPARRMRPQWSTHQCAVGNTDETRQGPRCYYHQHSGQRALLHIPSR
jgi:hypothetical protein